MRHGGILLEANDSKGETMKTITTMHWLNRFLQLNAQALTHLSGVAQIVGQAF